MDHSIAEKGSLNTHFQEEKKKIATVTTRFGFILGFLDTQILGRNIPPLTQQWFFTCH